MKKGLFVLLAVTVGIVIGLMLSTFGSKKKNEQKEESSLPIHSNSLVREKELKESLKEASEFPEEKESSIIQVNTGKIINQSNDYVIVSTGMIFEELQKIDLLRNSTWIYNFWFRDCQKEFKTPEAITECQRLALKEAAAGCIDPEGPGRLSVDELFTPQKYSFLSSWEIERARMICEDSKKYLQSQVNKEISERDGPQLNAYDILPNDPDSSLVVIGSGQQRVVINSPEACEKVINVAISQNSSQRQFWIERCKIGYVLNYWKWCKELENNKLREKCEEIYTNIELYKKLQEAYYVYGSFIRANPFYLPEEGQVFVKEKFDKER